MAFMPFLGVVEPTTVVLIICERIVCIWRSIDV